MKNILFLLGHRLVSKRQSLLYESAVAEGHSVRFVALPRKKWDISCFESDTSQLRIGLFSISRKGIRFKTRPDVVVCCNWSMLPVAFACKILFGSKLMYDENDYHEIMFKGLGDRFQKNISYLLVKLFKRLFLRSFDLITCCRLKLNLALRNLQEYNNNVLEINNYPTSAWRDGTIPYHQRGEKIFFVYSGKVQISKGCKAAAQAFLQAKSANETFIDAELHYFSSVWDDALLEWLGQQPGIYVHRSASPNEIRDFFKRRACVGLLLYQNTEYYRQIGTNSLKIYEYLALGAPVIAPALGDLEAFVSENDLGFIVKPDCSIEELMHLFKYIWENRPELDRMAANCKKIMSSSHMWWESEWSKIVSTGLLK